MIILHNHYVNPVALSIYYYVFQYTHIFLMSTLHNNLESNHKIALLNPIALSIDLTLIPQFLGSNFKDLKRRKTII